MKKQPEITEKTRQAFMDVFCELYSQKPIEKISIQEIANQSGYNRSTFYQYFSDIYELLDFVEADLLNYIKDELSKEQEPSVQNMLHCFEKESHMSALNALFGDYGSARFLERIKKEIPVDQWATKIPKDAHGAPYLFEFYISTALSLLRLWFRRQKDLSSAELFSLVHNLYTHGISSVENEKLWYRAASQGDEK